MHGKSISHFATDASVAWNVTGEQAGLPAATHAHATSAAKRIVGLPPSAPQKA
jgi:hypothetical protein